MPAQATSFDEERFARYKGYNPEFYKRAIKNNKERARQEAERRAAERTKMYELEREMAALEAQLAERDKLIAEKTANEKELNDTINDMRTAAQKAERVPLRHTIKMIEVRACKLFKVTPLELRSRFRKQKIAFARQFVCYWSRRLTSNSYPQIGRIMGGKDHTTVMHSVSVYPKKRAKMGRYLREVR